MQVWTLCIYLRQMIQLKAKTNGSFTISQNQRQIQVQTGTPSLTFSGDEVLSKKQVLFDSADLKAFQGRATDSESEKKAHLNVNRLWT